MKKAWINAVTLVLCLVMITGCTQRAQEPEPSSGADDLDAARMAIIDRNQDMLGGLTAEEMDADFEYLWELIRTSYPFLGVAERAGIDAEAIYTRYKENLPKVLGDITFMNYLSQMVAEFGYLGHFDFYNSASYYTYLRDTYAGLAGYGGHFGYLNEVMNDPKVADTYEKLAAVEAEVIALYQVPAGEETGGGDSSGGGDGLGQGAEEPTETGNLTTDFFPDYEAAYVKIASLLGENDGLAQDSAALLSFYEEAAEYGHLIIDITGNGGGSDYYWMQNIVAPNIREPLSASGYMLFARTPYTEGYLRAAAEESGAGEYPITDLPDMPALNADDAARMTGFTTTDITVEPSGNTPFEGRIWVLVDEQVYSSSETFAMVCKATGFATLVGHPTGGDGAGIDPMMFRLPNSGLVGRFSIFYTLNADGGGSEEMGTTPDIVCDEGETPLNTCLAAIKQSQ